MPIPEVDTQLVVSYIGIPAWLKDWVLNEYKGAHRIKSFSGAISNIVQEHRQFFSPALASFLETEALERGCDSVFETVLDIIREYMKFKEAMNDRTNDTAR